VAAATGSAGAASAPDLSRGSPAIRAGVRQLIDRDAGYKRDGKRSESLEWAVKPDDADAMIRVEIGQVRLQQMAAGGVPPHPRVRIFEVPHQAARSAALTVR
jgi:hypothetical protein